MQDGLRILIVEDDPLIATILEELIFQEGHSVCGIVGDSASVLENVKTCLPDLVCMDLHLKDGTSGLQLTRHITQNMQLPVIIISGASEEEVLEGVSESGAFSFLSKPIRPVALRMNLRIAIHTHTLQKDLAASEQRYRSIYNNAAMGIYVCHPSGHYITCNQAFASILGYTNPDELLKILRNQDEQLYAKTGRRQELLEQLTQTRGPVSMQSEVFGRDGDLLWLDEHCTPVFDADGVLLHYEGVVADITAGKRAEHALRTTYNMARTTIESLQDGVVVTDLEGHMIMANAAASDIAGAPLEEGNKVSCPKLNGTPHPFTRFLQEDFAPQSGVATIVPGRAPIYVSIAPFKNADDSVIGAVHVWYTAYRMNSER